MEWAILKYNKLIYLSIKSVYWQRKTLFAKFNALSALNE